MTYVLIKYTSVMISSDSCYVNKPVTIKKVKKYNLDTT